MTMHDYPKITVTDVKGHTVTVDFMVARAVVVLFQLNYHLEAAAVMGTVIYSKCIDFDINFNNIITEWFHSVYNRYE